MAVGPNTTTAQADLIVQMQNSLYAPPITVNGATDALPLSGTVFVQSAGVDAMTLATPVSGPQEVGGNDGQVLRVIDDGGHAHTITTASNKIVPSHHVLTFGGTRGQFIELRAFAGLWYPLALSGVTPS